MPSFRILYLATERREAFRSKTPGKPPYILTRSHYTDGPAVSADSPYSLWKEMRDRTSSDSTPSHGQVDIGDVLEFDGQMLLCNYWGFEPAEWRAPGGSRHKQGRGKAPSRAKV